jgi:hypothetical protein
VHVDEAIKAAFRAGEEPVDGALFVGLDVVFIEIFEEVLAQVFTKSFFNEAQVFFVVFHTEGDFQEVFEAGSDIVFKPVAIQDGDDVAWGGGEGGLCADDLQVILQGFALVGQDEAGLIQRRREIELLYFLHAERTFH